VKFLRASSDQLHRFQTIKENTAEESGIRNLALTIGIIVFSLGAGGLTMVIGYYSVFLILGSILMSVGAGLLYILHPDSGPGYWIGYQVVFAAGVGMSLEQCNIAVQTVLPDEQIPSGASLIIFARSLAGSIGSAIGQNVYQKSLRERISGLIPPGESFGSSGATDFVGSIKGAIGNDPERLQKIYQAINDSLTQVFMVAMILVCLTLPFAFTIEWKSVKKEKRAAEDAKEKSKSKKKPEEKNDSESPV
jgi:MFS family permease